MNHSIINASVTMNGLQRKLDVISNNMANMNTTGFKKREVSFEDLLTITKQQYEKGDLPGRMTPNGHVIGGGARVSQIQLDLSQGTLQTTSNILDLAIEGQAFFEVGRREFDANGNTTFVPAWTRNGSFGLSLLAGDPENSMLTTNEGTPVYGQDDQPIIIPNDREITIDAQGQIFTRIAGDPNTPAELVGVLKIVRAVSPQLLESYGDNLFILPDEFAGPEQRNALMQVIDLTQFAVNESPVNIRQGMLEGSNVDLPGEMSELIQMQRAFQFNARALTSAETMMNLTNNLRG
jgi:flagellar basal-body rod protein FlgG